jgi:hypothetical protein
MIPTPQDPYNNKIPGANDFLAVSQGDFLSDFGQLYNAFVRNHVALDAASSAGDHTNIQFALQGQGPNTNVGEISLYSKSVVKPSETFDSLFLRYQGGQAAGQEVQMTNYQLYQPENQPGQTGTFTFLPGGLILYFGFVNFSKTNSNLDLKPFITTNLIAVNFCTKGTIPLISPWVEILSEQPGLIKTLMGQSFVENTEYFYIVLGNT